MDHVLSGTCTSMNRSISINRFKDNIKEMFKVIANGLMVLGRNHLCCNLYYALLKDKPLLEEYLLCSTDFYGARSNTLPLNARTNNGMMTTLVMRIFFFCLLVIHFKIFEPPNTSALKITLNLRYVDFQN